MNEGAGAPYAHFTIFFISKIVAQTVKICYAYNITIRGITLKLMNKVIKFLIYSDLVFLSGFGLIAPIFAVFITGKDIGGSLTAVGIASACYWIPKCLVQLPVSRSLDRNPGEKDDYNSTLWGTFAICFIPLLYLLCRHPWHLYLVEGLHGVAAAFAFPGWIAIFTRHVDRNREAFEWSLYSTCVGLGTGVSAAVGGLLAEKFGFFALFALVSLISFSAMFFLVHAKKFILAPDGRRGSNIIFQKEDASGFGAKD